MKKEISDKLYLYNFILCMVVILIHAVNLAENNLSLHMMVATKEITGHVDAGLERYVDGLAYLQNFFANTLGDMAVPGFFAVSGYLFYRNFKDYHDIPKKWNSRIYSLLVPYGFFNTLWYGFYVAFGRETLSFAAFQEALTNYSCNPVFWYVYQLILLTALAPVLAVILRKKETAFGALAAILAVVYSGISLSKLNADALFYYTLGAVASKYLRDRIESTDARSNCRVGAELLLMAVLTGFCSLTVLGRISRSLAISLPAVLYEQKLQTLLTVVHRILMAAALWFFLPMSHTPVPYRVVMLRQNGTSAKALEQREKVIWKRQPSWEIAPWMKDTFFLYALHYPIVRGIRYIASMSGIGINQPEERLMLTAIYFLTPVLVLCTVSGIRRFLLTFAPKLYKMMSGNRH